jgi:hypothetical protein
MEQMQIEKTGQGWGRDKKKRQGSCRDAGGGLHTRRRGPAAGIQEQDVRRVPRGKVMGVWA